MLLAVLDKARQDCCVALALAACGEIPTLRRDSAGECIAASLGAPAAIEKINGGIMGTGCRIDSKVAL